MNRSHLVTSETRRKVLSALSDCGVDISELEFEEENEKLIVFNAPTLKNMFYSPIISSARLAASRRGYNLLVNEDPVSSESLHAFLRLLRSEVGKTPGEYTGACPDAAGAPGRIYADHGPPAHRQIPLRLTPSRRGKEEKTPFRGCRRRCQPKGKADTDARDRLQDGSNPPDVHRKRRNFVPPTSECIRKMQKSNSQVHT